MKPRVKVGTATAPDGTPLELYEHDGEFLLTADGSVLMTTRMKSSEEELAKLAVKGIGARANVLIGGLGFGFTLRATLDALRADARVIQAELVPEIVAWNRGPLGERSGNPLEDPRVNLVVEDVMTVIRRRQADLDAIILDIDNGPSPMVTRSNGRLYSEAGLAAMHAALKPGGRLAVWSSDQNERLPNWMRTAGFDTSVERVRARGDRGARHVVILGRARLRRGD